ncbi:FecCD family ABC transporter permease [Bacillus solimangrovi]|uniref:Iron-siderophore ABC transporter permease n=1 Tax=Bacillus solimangrovi TaxID=1305675 RepID=A0A1E5LCE5_9BACI|nr:iron ABC transporter permease [Bacillus solimangrovi]OEH91756.1 iron-siderophore ABC transporter permease [Bacillus solimangrovi]
MNKRVFQIVLFIAGLILLLIGLVLSVSVGAVDINFSTVIGAILSFDQSKEHMIISTIRLPRAIIGAIIGMNLAVAGALMQALTRNPMASPQIFGVNAGASLVVVSATVLLPNISPSTLVYFAFIGAAIGGLVVYTMASSGGSIAPVKLALAGMAVHLFFSSITEALIIFNETTTEAILFWLAGAIDGSTWNDIGIIMPWSLVGLLISILLSRSISVFSLGEDVAKGLGQKIEIIRIVSGITVIVLAGSSVAIAGPIGFVGLIIPHITRAIVGIDYRVVIPFSALFGALLLVYADVASRFIAFPFESPVGIVTALIGAPFFLYLARKGGKLS